MRTQFFFVGLLSIVAGALVGTAGCDNITAGTPSDSSAPPQLVHVLIQDARYLGAWPNRASSLDILDNYSPRACTITQAKTATDPQLDTCINEFLIDGFAPDVSCTSAGICGDPFKIPASGVPVPQTAAYLTGATDMRDPGGGVQVRIVFDKVLDDKIEKVEPSGSMTPGLTNKYTLMAGILELDDEAGKPVDSEMYIDDGGSSIYSSDLEFVPLGPALVIKPTAGLDAATKYTVKILNPGALTDRSGRPAVGVGGGALPTSFSFTTEALTQGSAGVFGASALDYPDFVDASADMPAVIAPNEAVQISFFENIAGDTATATVTGPAGVTAIAYSDRGADPSACATYAAGMDPSGIILDVVNADSTNLATAMSKEWPEGDYTLTVTVKDINGKTSYTSDPLMFTVMGPDSTDAMNPNLLSAHVTPAQCTM